MITMQDIIEAATLHGFEVLGMITSDSGGALVKFVYELSESSTLYFSSGWLGDEQQALEFAYGIMQETTGEIMNLLKNDKLFPNIRGVMLKEKPVTLHLSGKVKITELQGGDARVELFFDDHKKTAVINRNQALNIIDAHGPETDAWKGKAVVLYAEEGVWFGKHQYGLRVDAEATKRVTAQEAKKAPKKPTKAERGEVASFEKDIDESDLVDLAELEEMTDLEAEQANLDLFGDASTATGNNYDEA